MATKKKAKKAGKETLIFSKEKTEGTRKRPLSFCGGLNFVVQTDFFDGCGFARSARLACRLRFHPVM